MYLKCKFFHPVLPHFFLSILMLAFLFLSFFSRLLFGGTAVEDTATLESKKVEPGSVIHMVLSLRGGSL